MDKPFPPFDPEGTPDHRQRRLRDIPFRAIFPNLITLLAICAGLTSIRLSVEGRVELAIAAVILAALLDALDGRAARFLKSTSRFGAQMDSLADFVNFGVAPALLLYFLLLDEIRSFGWIAALIFAICACLRLARFNVMLDTADRPNWQNNYFVGVPAPAGALVVLAPVYAVLLGVESGYVYAIFTALYAVVIGLAMVSNLPTFSGKEIGKRVPRDYVLPIMIVLVTAVAMLLTYPWATLLFCVALYLGSIPVSYHFWGKQVRSAATSRQDKAKPSVRTRTKKNPHQ